MRLVYLSPPVSIRSVGRLRVAEWKPKENRMPFKYERAPLLVDNHGRTDFPRVKELLRAARRGSWIARFSSGFRSRKKPLEPEVAAVLVKRYSVIRARASKTAIAQYYYQAVPFDRPMKVDLNRRKTYDRRLRSAKGGC